ncbi:SsgA family sporulation/cell division regulator [Streptomyces sp. JJ66]|uniref:SsgA family sporulation/cell division regulator n=1 Tax=Streptomyces sp. JJ66 TaxID=2803843 RepID=UPI001C583FE1|nr:SsgA family sporulation/cell division regulator [Streptomyces sp. JJ66]MBW1603188.1 SsgA family sporulation/cell division regulator [Streptomyces sp. JJ66]
MQTTIERELELTLVLPPDRRVPVPSKLSYRTDDPFAVHVDFHLGSPRLVHWTFARELLVEGVFRPSGDADVRVWPAAPRGTRAGRRTVVCVALSSPEGEALLEAPAGPLGAWLERTLRLVPPGEECAEAGFDEALGALLGGGPGA